MSREAAYTALEFQREFSACLDRLRTFRPRFPGEFGELCTVAANECGRYAKPSEAPERTMYTTRMARRLASRIGQGDPSKWRIGTGPRWYAVDDFSRFLHEFGASTRTSLKRRDGTDHRPAAVVLYKASADFCEQMAGNNPKPFELRPYLKELSEALSRQGSRARIPVGAGAGLPDDPGAEDVPTQAFRPPSARAAPSAPENKPEFPKAPSSPGRPRFAPSPPSAEKPAPEQYQPVMRKDGSVDWQPPSAGNGGGGASPRESFSALARSQAAPKTAPVGLAPRESFSAPARPQPAPAPASPRESLARRSRPAPPPRRVPTPVPEEDDDLFGGALSFLDSTPEEKSPAPGGSAHSDSAAAAIRRTVPGIRRDLSGLRLGQFKLDTLLAEGPSGQIYGATHPKQMRRVAVKPLERSRDAPPERVKKFLEDARRLVRVDHRNIVRIIEAEEEDGIVFVVMERLEGAASAKQSMAAKGTQGLGEQRALELARAAADALFYAYEAFGLIHGDVKPSSIVVARTGQPKLSNLGLAKVALGNPREMTLAEDTPNYLAPEAVDDLDRLDFRSDIYALGATLFHMMTGMPPFSGDTADAVYRAREFEATPDPRKANGDVSAPAAWLVTRMMAKNPDDRFQSYEELLEAIDAVRAGKTPSARNKGGGFLSRLFGGLFGRKK